MGSRTGTRVFGDGGRLTPRQEQVVRLLAQGKTNGEVADELGISLDGAKFHVTELMNRYGVHSREEAVAAWKQGGRRTFGLPLAAPLVWGGAVAAVAVVVIVAMAVWTSTLDSGDDSMNLTQTVLDVAVKRAGASTTTFTMLVTVTQPGELPVESALNGEIDFKNDRMALHGPGVTEQVWDGDVSYVRFVSGGQFRKFRASETGGTFVFIAKQWMERISGASEVLDLGEDAVNGEIARRFRATTDLSLAEDTPAHLVEFYQNTEVHLDIWIAKGRIVRLEQDVTFENTGDPEIDGGRHAIRIEFADWDAPVSIRVPDPSEVEE